jgi:hypothetical protein
MNKFFVKLIWESPVGALIYRVWEYFDTKRERKAYRAILMSKARTVQVQHKSLLLEGIRRIKRGIKAAYDVKDLSSGRIRDVDPMNFAKGDNDKMAETLRKVYVYNEKDIKTESDKEKMIYRRISHYKEKQGDVIKRQFLREIRKEQNPQKKQELEKEFYKKYAK